MAWKKLAFIEDVASLTDTAPIDITFGTAAVGTATTAMRQDAKPCIDEGAVGSIEAIDGGAASLGTAHAVPHIDHRHGLGPLVANLDFDGHEADDFKLETQATEPTTGTVAGRLYYNSSPGTVHPFVWQA